ncbi:preprotein translocase subunit SecY [Nakamurella antarctica]|uniref:Protein translocase subunit SecY n=1 Tax=Nakamurella antarctica TaxID=1902245 RepID=A0A3G8ZNF8_9ACTN|nr:preprotein translocase subunit SecY [Nakamurella antarctica]AZI58678.1 preprotein translocase subunit SecY [Nakamurella antarctica]
MLTAFVSALKTPDLRKKILFTLGMLAIYRIGTSIPSPGVSYKAINQCIDANVGGTADVYTLLNLFSGGALLQLSIFALGIMPYITASIITQLLTVVIPRFEELKKQGQAGQAKMTQYTRYLTIALGILQSTAFIALAMNGSMFPNCAVKDQLIPDQSALALITLVLTMTAGTAAVMWMGELITDRGIGNGMSLLIFTSIASRIPAEGGNILTNQKGVIFTIFCGIALVVITAVVFVEQGQRRLQVQYAKRMIGRRQYGGTSTYLPLKVNQAGVIPVIFATSLLYIPTLLIQLIGGGVGRDADGNYVGGGWQLWVQRYIVDQGSWSHILLYFALIIFFTYFYVGITFNPTERADDLKKYGGFIPGIRPGRPTAEYLQYVLSRITLPGSLYLGIVAILPNLFLEITGSNNNQNFPFGGTAVLIMVGVGLDTIKQIETQLMQRNYEGFLR